MEKKKRINCREIVNKSKSDVSDMVRGNFDLSLTAFNRAFAVVDEKCESCTSMGGKYFGRGNPDKCEQLKES